jgi:hypothetical protein
MPNPSLSHDELFRRAKEATNDIVEENRLRVHETTVEDDWYEEIFPLSEFPEPISVKGNALSPAHDLNSGQRKVVARVLEKLECLIDIGWVRYSG